MSLLYNGWKLWLQYTVTTEVTIRLGLFPQSPRSKVLSPGIKVVEAGLHLALFDRQQIAVNNIPISDAEIAAVTGTFRQETVIWEVCGRPAHQDKGRGIERNPTHLNAE